MGKYILRRLILTIPTILLMSILIFGGVRFIPGNVCILVLQNPEATEEQCEAVYQRLGMDKPAVGQYFDWMGGVLQGDLGRSMISDQAVSEAIRSRLGLTIELATLTGIFALAVGIPIGVFSALKQDSAPDYILRILTIGWLAMPSFWIASMLISYPAKWWGYSAPAGYAHLWEDPLLNLEKLYMPVLALGLSYSANLARLTRSSMLEVLRQDYMRTARAKGLRERDVLFKHALKNTMLPVITIFGLQFSWALSGTIVLETIFGLPGLGTLLLSGVVQKDFTTVQGLVLFYAIVVIILNLLIDLSYSWLDPRVKYS